MDKATGLRRLMVGEAALKKRAPQVKTREEYVRGVQKLPYAPEGVNEEYQDLREQAPANYMGIAVGAPTQRLRADKLKTNLGEDADKRIWAALQANKFDTRQTLFYRSMFIHGRGIASVWPNKKIKERPIIRPESYGLVHIEMDPDDPFTPEYAVKIFTIEEASPLGQGLILPASTTTTRTVGIVYDDTSMIRFERGGFKGTGEWDVVLEGTHPMRRVPFALYDYQPDTTGQPWSAIDVLIPQQDAINTIRFDTLLALQFSAYRQKIITGFDPRATDGDGNILYKRNTDGTPVLDANGNAIPVLNSPGRVGVDRLLAFPGAETKVFDLPESNMKNYIEVLSSFLVQFFSTAQIPPQYLLAQMANLGGDALAGAESTLQSLVNELQLAAGEGNEDLGELTWYAMGESEEYLPTSETGWMDAEARSFAQIIDAITKLISVDFPHRAAFGFIPGATKTKVDEWMLQMEDESFANRIALAARPFQDITVPPVNDQTEITDGAPAGGS